MSLVFSVLKSYGFIWIWFALSFKGFPLCVTRIWGLLFGTFEDWIRGLLPGIFDCFAGFINEL